MVSSWSARYRYCRDIDVDTVEAKLKAVFADVQKPVNPAERTYYPVTDNKEPIVAIGTDKEVETRQLRFTSSKMRLLIQKRIM